MTFFVMFIAAFLTGTLASRMKNGSRQLAHVAFRTRVLFETNQLLQQKKTRTEIVSATAHQLMKLLNRDIIFYLAKDGKLGEAQVFRIEGTDIPEDYVSEEEKRPPSGRLTITAMQEPPPEPCPMQAVCIWRCGLTTWYTE